MFSTASFHVSRERPAADMEQATCISQLETLNEGLFMNPAALSQGLNGSCCCKIQKQKKEKLQHLKGGGEREGGGGT